MTLLELLTILKSLNALQGKGGKQFSQIATLLASEATTHNCEEAQKLLASITNRISG